MPSLFDTFWVLHFRFASMESIVLGLPDLAWLLMFLQHKQNFLSYDQLDYHFCTRDIFGCFHSVMAQFKLVMFKFSN